MSSVLAVAPLRGTSTNGSEAPSPATMASASLLSRSTGSVSPVVLRQLSASCSPIDAEPADDTYNAAPAAQKTASMTVSANGSIPNQERRSRSTWPI